MEGYGRATWWHGNSGRVGGGRFTNYMVVGVFRSFGVHECSGSIKLARLVRVTHAQRGGTYLVGWEENAINDRCEPVQNWKRK